MKLQPNRLVLALLLTSVAPMASAGVVIDTIGGSEISFEGLIQADYYHYDSDFSALDGDPGDGDGHDQGVRRAELVLEGSGPGNFDWAVGYDLNSHNWLDVVGEYRFGADGRYFVKLGQFKQPNSLEELSSTKNNDFISKAMTTNTFAISRRLGVAYGYANGTWGITASAFGSELTDGGDHGSGFGARGTFAPINREGEILHFGLSYIDRDTDADRLRLRTRPQADLAGVRLVDTGTFTDADRLATTGLESFWVHGPFKLQGEYMRGDVDRLVGQDFTATGTYLSAVYNLTGETWGYKGGLPRTTAPTHPASGMWQVGLRYDTVDLNDAGVAGGRMDAWTAGVNWYWRSNFKFMLNYVKVGSERLGISDNPNIVSARLQFYW